MKKIQKSCNKLLFSNVMYCKEANEEDNSMKRNRKLAASALVGMLLMGMPLYSMAGEVVGPMSIIWEKNEKVV